MNDLLISIINDGLKDGSIVSQQDAKLLANTFFGAMNWTVHWYNADQYKNIEDTISNMVKILIASVER